MLITSTANARIKEVRKLSKRKHRQKSGRLLVEGMRLVQDAWESHVRPELVIYAPELLTHQDADALVDALRDQGVEILPCTPSVFASLAETVTPQGIAAVLPLPHLPLPAAPNFVLLLDGIRDPGNAGTLLRSAEAAGCDLVLFCPGSVDAFNDKVLRAGMGAHFRLPLRTCTTWNDVQQFIPTAVSWYVADAGSERHYDAVDWTTPAALVIGSEADGPSAEARARAHTVSIPMRGQTESLNAAMAGSIILFEAARQRRVARR